MLNTISTNRVNVTVANHVFSIPADKLNQVITLLQSLQSIHVSDNSNPFIEYKGKTLING
jgi:hypothetical protein